ncbi:MAG: hypothetical protein LBQ60_02595 [Bacteroidales bacterium]|jgi:glycosyltransferase involved in cell wall biosynthesis|nr:hypothetical protein [Bacteroidales bacterium]
MTVQKKVLVITYYWPPSGGPGVQRWLKFVKFLPEFGITPVVLTVRPENAEYPIIDESLNNEIAPDLKVYRTTSKGAYDWYKRITGKKTAPYSGFANEGNPSLIQKIARFIRGNFFLPDARRGWIKYAFREASRLISQHGIQTIITTGPPHSTHLTGLKLKKKYPVKWIADFRDPWTSIYYNDFLYQTRLAKSIDLKNERRVVMKSDIILVAADRKSEFIKNHHQLDPEKIVFFPNGYDDLDFEGKTQIIPDVFTIRYIGTMAPSYPVHDLLKVLSECPFDFRLELIGQTSNVIEEMGKQLLGRKFKCLNFVPHKESINYMLSSSVLLLVIPQTADNRFILPGKLFEYLISGKQILALGPLESTASKIIREAGSGENFMYQDKEGIRRFLNEQYQYWKDRSYADVNIHYIRQFSRKELTRQLAEMI